MGLWDKVGLEHCAPSGGEWEWRYERWWGRRGTCLVREIIWGCFQCYSELFRIWRLVSWMKGVSVFQKGGIEIVCTSVEKGGRRHVIYKCPRALLSLQGVARQYSLTVVPSSFRALSLLFCYKYSNKCKNFGRSLRRKGGDTREIETGVEWCMVARQGPREQEQWLSSSRHYSRSLITQLL